MPRITYPLFFLAILLLFAECNTSVNSNTNNVADRLNKVKTAKALTDSLMRNRLSDSLKKQCIADSLTQIDNSNLISLDSADGIVLRIMRKSELDYAPQRRDTVVYNTQFKSSLIMSENGYLYKQQRAHAVYDKYIRLEAGMMDVAMQFISIESLSVHIHSFRDSIAGIIQYLKRNKGSSVQILEYYDLRYGQMCNPMSPNRARLIAAYMLSQGVDSSSCIAVGFGYDEPYIMKENDGVLKKGDTLDGEYISKLKKNDQNKAYDILNGVQVELIVLPPPKA